MSSRIPRRFLPVFVLGLVLFAVPVGVFASHQFSDVPTGSLFHGDIDAIADAGVTSGCGAGKYCPDAFVTRGEMAAFMNRLGALAPEKVPVVNADRLDGYQANAMSRVASSSFEATLVGSETTGRIAVQIVAPSRGWILMSGSAAIYNTSTNLAAHADCYLQVNDEYIVGSERGIDTDFRSGGPLIDQGVCATNGGYEVCGAGVYTIDLEFEKHAQLQVLQSSLIAQFSPFGGTGALPACTSSRAPTSPADPPLKDAG